MKKGVISWQSLRAEALRRICDQEWLPGEMIPNEAELAEGRLDTAIVALPVSEPALAEVALFSEEFVLLRPASEAGNPVPGAEVLREMRLLLLEEGHCFRDQALSFCAMTATQPQELLDGSSLTTLVQMVGSGIGVTLIPEMAVPLETRMAEVSIARFRAPRPTRTIGMVWRKTSPLSRQLAEIAQVVRQVAEEMGLGRAEVGGAKVEGAGNP